MTKMYVDERLSHFVGVRATMRQQRRISGEAYVEYGPGDVPNALLFAAASGYVSDKGIVDGKRRFVLTDAGDRL